VPPDYLGTRGSACSFNTLYDKCELRNQTHRAAGTNVQAVWALPSLISAVIAREIPLAHLTQAAGRTRVSVACRLINLLECCHVEHAAHRVYVQSIDAREIAIPR
jgi:hypothetical protein